MGFRNPITSLSASQITPGELPAGVILPDGSVTGTKLAADAIDGMVVTGATVRSSGAGNRTVLDSTGLRFRDDDLVYGLVEPIDGAGVNPAVTITATGQEAASGGLGAFIRLVGAVAVPTAAPTEVQLSAEQINLLGTVKIGSEPALHGTVSVQAATTTGFALPAGGGSVDVTGSVVVAAPAGHDALSIIVAVGAVASGTVAASDTFSIWRDGTPVKIARPAIVNNPVTLFFAEKIPAGVSHSYWLHFDAANACTVTSDNRFVYLYALQVPIGT